MDPEPLEAEPLASNRIAFLLAEDMRRAGVPVIRAHFDEHEAIVFVLATPAGHG